MIPNAPVKTDIVLIGGGHAHVHVLKSFTMRPEAGVRLTLIARDLETPYSGMVPGLIAGLYRHEQAHIDLVKLCAATGARLIHAEATGLDRINKRVLLTGRAPLGYDLVSIDVGIEPDLSGISGAEHGIAVKPIGSFLKKFEAVMEKCRSPEGPRRMSVVGGGAGGVELLLSMRSRILAEAVKSGRNPEAFSFALVTDGEILATHNARVGETFRRILREKKIALHEYCKVQTLTTNEIVCGERRIAADAVFLTTHAVPPALLRESGLKTDAGGFLSVTPMLQSITDPDVFAVGDCAALSSPREKAGVYAVRAGPPLADNLRRRARGEEAKPWRPQQRHLALVSTGERYAVASRGAFKAEGAWLWILKDWIDRKWMRMYQEFDPSKMAKPSTPSQTSVDEELMRCGGCAAKIGPGPLSRALARLPAAKKRESVVVGLDAPDDAAVVTAPVGKHIVQTVDFFRAFIGDPYLFGKIAANHALNDIFAMGGEPCHAMATAVVPAGPSAKVEEDLFQLIAGARATFDREGVALIGGHSSEGAELAAGFSVSGEISPEKILRKGGLKAGDALILTRPLGTGILFAAAMRAQARAPWIEAALAAMQQSNRQASQILIANGARAMTDVTGFGFAGHLGEMLAASGADAEIDLAALPLYDGALELTHAGIRSTLLPENLALAGMLRGQASDETKALLFDPQTSGGMLAGVPAEKASACLVELTAAGCTAAIVGKVMRNNVTARDVCVGLTGRLP